MSEEKTRGQRLAEELFYKKKSAFELWSEDERKAAMEYCTGYSKFLDDAKTEREAVIAGIEMLKAAGFKAYTIGDKLTAGDKVYYNNRNKSLYAMVIGTEDINEGVRISAAHIDSPRLDLK
ncbi:MAG: aminopeptidase, partial [Clostridia bacterium]|nr:aminopeptidase [Clostridia bacterium]